MAIPIGDCKVAAILLCHQHRFGTEAADRSAEPCQPEPAYSDRPMAGTDWLTTVVGTQRAALRAATLSVLQCLQPVRRRARYSGKTVEAGGARG
jgi:hypothetical protein